MLYLPSHHKIQTQLSKLHKINSFDQHSKASVLFLLEVHCSKRFAYDSTALTLRTLLHGLTLILLDVPPYILPFVFNHRLLYLYWPLLRTFSTLLGYSANL